MQFPGAGKPPVAIVFDSAMGQRIDDALALAMLYGFDGKDEARLISVSVSKSNLKAAAFCDAVGRFYAGAVSGEFGGRGRTLPVGLSDAGKLPGDTPMITVPLSKLNVEGKPVHAHDIRQWTDTAEVPALIRNAFTSQPDQNSIVVLTGPATELAKVLELHGAKDVIVRKVKFLTVAAAELNNPTDIAAAKKVFSEWPTPIFCVSPEAGEAVPYPASSIEQDFTWSPAHPIVDAYRAHKTMPYDAPAYALAAALYAVRPQEGYFKLSEPGTIRVLDDGRIQFTPSPDGRHRNLLPDPAQKERILKVYTEVASAKPATRQRFRPQQKKPDPPKPAVRN